MITLFKRTAVASLAALTLSAAAVATPASAASSAWRDHHVAHSHSDHWRGGGCEGAGCYRYGYGPFYRGYGHNSNNWCYSGESMYDGC